MSPQVRELIRPQLKSEMDLAEVAGQNAPAVGGKGRRPEAFFHDCNPQFHSQRQAFDGWLSRARMLQESRCSIQNCHFHLQKTMVPLSTAAFALSHLRSSIRWPVGITSWMLVPRAPVPEPRRTSRVAGLGGPAPGPFMTRSAPRWTGGAADSADPAGPGRGTRLPAAPRRSRCRTPPRRWACIPADWSFRWGRGIGSGR